MKPLRGLLLKPTLNLLSWILRRRNGDSIIIGGPLGWLWQATLDTTHHGALAGPANAHRHSDLADIGIDNHHARDHATRHQNGGADEISVAGLSGELADDQKTTWTKVSSKPASPSLEEMATEHQADGTHGAITPTSCTQKYTHPTTGTCPQAPKAHKDTHDPIDGSDKLDTAAPVKVGSANAIGSSHSLARADHVHQREHAIYSHPAAAQCTTGRFGKGRLGWTANKLLKGAGTGSDPTEIDVPAGKSIATGSYAGNGYSSRQITTGFKCSLVLVYDSTNDLAATCFNIISVKPYAMDGSDQSAYTELHATDGFTVAKAGDGVNVMGRLYYYWAISE